jgi:AraC-like DNA-binding protein
MTFVFDGRAPESPLIDTIWRTQSEGSGDSFISTAATQMSIVITRENGRTWLTVRGPETKASNAGIPQDAEFFGINFKLGTFLTKMPGNTLVDGEINLPEAGSNSFWLNGAAWEFPRYDNADVFVARLIHEGLLAQDEIVTGILQNQPAYASIRTVRRRFLHATGLTHKVIQQIERAQQALTLLQGGTPILDAALTLGYFDQAHMTNSLRRFVGQTPTQILRVDGTK